MAKIVTLKNSNDEEVYPITTAEAVNGSLYADSEGVPSSVTADITSARIVDGAVTADKISWTTFIKQTEMPIVSSTSISSAWTATNIGSALTVSGLDASATYSVFAMTAYTETGGVGEFRLRATGANTVQCNSYAPGHLCAVPYQLQGVRPNASGQIVFQRAYSGDAGNVRCGQCYITILRTA